MKLCELSPGDVVRVTGGRTDGWVTHVQKVRPPEGDPVYHQWCVQLAADGVKLNHACDSRFYEPRDRDGNDGELGLASAADAEAYRMGYLFLRGQELKKKAEGLTEEVVRIAELLDQAVAHMTSDEPIPPEFLLKL